MRRTYSKFVRFTAVFVVFMMICTVSAFAIEVKVGTVIGDSLNLRNSLSTSAGVLDKADKDDKVVALEKSGDWYRVVYNQTYGYMHADFLKISAAEDFDVGPGRVNATAVNFRKGPTTGSGVIRKFSNGEQVNVVGVESGWYKVVAGEKTGYIHPDYLTIFKNQSDDAPADDASQKEAADGADDKDTLRGDIIAYAKTFLGCSYKYGSSNGKTFDCSGFTTYVFKHFGYSLNRSAAGQVSNGSKVSSRDKLKPGDLVLFRDPSINRAAASHVGIYIGDGKFIHCSSRGGGVKYNSLSDSYYNKYYIGGRRIVE